MTNGTGSVSSRAIGPNPNQYTVNLSGVIDQQYIAVTLSNVVDATGAFGDVASPQMGVLIGDTTANGAVNSSDIAQTQSQSGQAVTSSNFREDVTANGAITAPTSRWFNPVRDRTAQQPVTGEKAQNS